MKKKTSLIVLALLIPSVVLMHVSCRTFDDRLMFNVDGRDVDFIGMAKEWVRTTTNRCQSVHQLQSDDPQLVRIKAVIQSYSPPDSRDIKAIHVWTTENWAIAEVEFEKLLPAVVTINNVDASPTIVEGAIWSGTTAPWKSSPHIRSYLKNRSNDTPQDLLNCFELLTNSLK